MICRLASANMKNKTRTLKGVVVSDKMQKTAVVAVTRLVKHPKIKKYYKVTKKYKSHNENNKFKTGQTVIIRETRPMSKEKRWTILSKA